MKWSYLDKIIALMVLAGTLYCGFKGFGWLREDWAIFLHWKNWETSAILFTGIYSIYELIKGIIKRDFLGGQSIFVGIGGILLLFICYLLIREEINRLNTLLLLIITTIIICGLDWTYIKSFKEKGYAKIPDKESRKRNFWYCNFPTLIVFFVLFCYAWEIGDSDDKSEFFAGAITFQLIISNVIWTYN